jgi:membrane protein YdbS with pleckstrin-like domain
VKDRVEVASRWIYRGVWAILVRLFRVPERPPSLPVFPGDEVQVFQPAVGFLSYLKFQFWIVVTVVNVPIFIGWLAIALAEPLVGLILVIPALAITIVPEIIAYVAIYLRYDTTWYVMTSRSLRIRRGIWTIHETTITFENVQNLAVHQGPLERFFGIGNVLVQTAGGGGQTTHEGQAASLGGHRGLIEGVADPQSIRDLILPRLRQAKTAGLGDDDDSPAAHHGWSAQHLAVLLEIRGLAQQLALAG